MDTKKKTDAYRSFYRQYILHRLVKKEIDIMLRIPTKKKEKTDK